MHEQSVRYMRLEGHRDNIFALAWSPNGDLLASAGRDSTVRLWDITTGTLQATYYDPASSCFLSLAWSPDGRYLAAGCTAGPVYLWDVPTRNETPLLTYRGHRRFVRAVVWSPDGMYIASGGDLGDSTVQVWSPTSGQICYTYTAQYRIFALDWSPDGGHIASASFDGTAHVWSACGGEPVHIYRAHGAPIYALDWSARHGYLASAGEDATLHLWTIPSARTLEIPQTPHALDLHTHPIKALCWSPDGTCLASAGHDALLYVYSPFAPEPRATLQTLDMHRVWIRALAWSPDGACLASCSASTLCIWRVSPPKEKGEGNGVVYS